MSVSIFNMGQRAESVAQERSLELGNGGAKTKLFNPMADKAGDTMSMLVRIMPFVKRALDADGKQVVDANGNKQYIMSPNFSDNIVHKYFYVAEHEGRTIWFDSPVNVGKYCPMVEIWRKLNNSSDPNVKNFAAQFKRKHSSTCYIQIISAPSFPEMQGKIVPFAVPFELTKFMDDMLNPSDDDRALGTQPVLPYDIMNAPVLKLSYKAETVPGIKVPVRKWSVVAVPDKNGRNEAYFAVGNDSANPWVYATEMGEQAVLEHIASQEDEDIVNVYGHHEPTNDNIYQWYLYLRSKLAWIPGFVDKISNWLYFKWCSEKFEAENGGANQPAAQPIAAKPAAPAPATEQPAEQPAAPAPAPAQPAAPAPAQPAVPQSGKIDINDLPV